MTTAQRILKNILSLTFADFFNKFLGVITVAYLARILGPGNFGKINFALAIVGYFLIIANPGLDILGIREVAASKEKISVYVKNILGLKIFLALLAFLLLFILALVIHQTDIKYLIIFYGLTIFTTAILIEWLFQGIEKMEYIALARIVTAILYLGMILVFIKTPEHLLRTPLLLVMATIPSVILLFLIYLKNYSLGVSFDLSSWKNLIKNSLPFGLTSVMSIVIYNTGIIMLGFMKTTEAVGYFTAAQKITFMLISTISVYYTATFPVISNFYKTSTESFNKINSYSFKLMLILGLPTAVGITVLAAPIISLLYGPKFMNASVVLQILIWNAFMVFINTNFSKILWAANHQKDVLKIVAIQAIAIVILNLIFILTFGAIGASIVMVVGEIIAFFIYYNKTKVVAPIHIHKYFLCPSLASIIMMLFLLICKNWNLFLLIFFAAIIYFFSLYLFKGIRKPEVKLFLNTLGIKTI